MGPVCAAVSVTRRLHREQHDGHRQRQAVRGRHIERARAALATFKTYDQEQVDESVTGVAWAICKPANVHQLAILGAEDSGMWDRTDFSYIQ
jgi:hypothetical protein